MEQALGRIRLTVSKLDKLHEQLSNERHILKAEINDLSSSASMWQCKDPGEQALQTKTNGVGASWGLHGLKAPKDITPDGGFHRPVNSITMDLVGPALQKTSSTIDSATLEVDSPGSPTNTKRSGEFSLKPSAESAHARFQQLRGLSTDSKLAAPNWMEGNLELRKKRGGMRQSTLHLELLEQLSVDEKFEKSHPLRGKFRRLAQRKEFDFFCGFFISLSAILIGVETQWEATDDNFDSYALLLYIAQVICALVYLFEIITLLIAYGKGFIWLQRRLNVSRQWKWNCFDLVCLVITIVDLLLVWKQDQNTLVFFFRQFRIVRALRLLRTARFAAEFRKMSYALQYSAGTLLWAILTLACVIFFFAIAFTQATTVHVQENSDQDHTFLKDSFGTVPLASHSLFQAISGGVDWGQIIEPLMRISWAVTTIFLVYIAVTTFGVMNVVTSVFVEAAVASHHHYKEVLIEEKILSMKVYIDHLKDIFVQIDRLDRGEINMDDLELFLSDPSLQRYLDSIDIYPDDAITLFKLLDKDESGMVDLDEFCAGCVRLRGEAKSFDVHCMIYENQRMMHKFQEFQRYLDKGFLSKFDHALEERLATILRTPERLPSQHSQRSLRSQNNSSSDVRQRPTGSDSSRRLGDAPIKNPSIKDISDERSSESSRRLTDAPIKSPSIKDISIERDVERSLEKSIEKSIEMPRESTNKSSSFMSAAPIKSTVFVTGDDENHHRVEPMANRTSASLRVVPGDLPYLDRFEA